MSVLSRVIERWIIYVSQKTLKEKPERTEWGNSGGRWHDTRRGTSVYLFPNEELPTQSNIPCHRQTALRIVVNWNVY